MRVNKLKKYIDYSGGQSEVARKLNVHRQTIWRWETKGFPHTEWSGATAYSIAIAELCRKNGYPVLTDEVRMAGKQ